MSPNFLVLLAAYNGMKWISDQVHSILNQNGVSVTLIISIDSSNDGTEEWALALSERNPKVLVLETGKKFGGAAPNFFRLINEASLKEFDYFSFADQDDIWLPNKLIEAVETRRRQKLSATPDLSGTVLPLCHIPNSALKNAPPSKSATPRASACAGLLA